MALGLSLGAVACSGSADTIPGGGAAPVGGPESQAGAPSVIPGGPDAVVPPGTVAGQACATPTAGTPPLRRLTRREYNNTIRDLLGAEPLPIESLGVDEKPHVFATNTLAPITELQFSRYAEAAAGIASRGVAAVSAAAGCVAGADAAATATCAQQLVTDFGRKAFRRPLTTEETAGYLELFNTETSEAGVLAGAQLVIETMLQSPHFLYRVELGSAPGGTGVVTLSPYEVASRISYFLWATTPDDALLAAAAAGSLSTPAGIEVEVRRMLSDPKAEDAVHSFFGQWMGIDTLVTADKDATAFPDWNETIAQAMLEETRNFTSEIVLKGDARLETLLLSPSVPPTPELAAWYGATPRLGLLTQGSLLTFNAHYNQTSPVRRGLFVRERLLCQKPPPPPPGLDTTPPMVDENVSTRERFSMHRDNPSCSGCHSQLDPIGFGFEAFDAVGRLRTTDGNQPVDESGELLGTDVDGVFRGPAELATKLSGSKKVQECMAQNWMEFAIGPTPASDAACSLGTAGAAFQGSNLDLRELIVAITRSDAFLHIRLN